MCGFGCVGREHRTSECYLCRAVSTDYLFEDPAPQRVDESFMEFVRNARVVERDLPNDCGDDE